MMSHCLNQVELNISVGKIKISKISKNTDSSVDLPDIFQIHAIDEHNVLSVDLSCIKIIDDQKKLKK